MRNANRQSETRNASVLPYTYSPAGSNWLYQLGSDIRVKTFNGNTASMSTATPSPTTATTVSPPAPAMQG